MKKRLWYRIRKFFGQLSGEEKREEAAALIRESLHAHTIPPFDLAADMKANPLKYGYPINLPGNVTQGPENIPGPHPKPKKKKRPVRSITDNWEVTQDQEMEN